MLEAGPIWGKSPGVRETGSHAVSREALSLPVSLLAVVGRSCDIPWFRTADVVQLYNTHGGYFSHSSEVASRREALYLAIVGHVAADGPLLLFYDCERWKTGCGTCPLLSDEPR